MKNKLDLNNLLAKYEGISANESNNYYSPGRQRGQYENALNDQGYQSRVHTYEQANYNYQPSQRRTVVEISGNFQMSKSQCQQFLQRVREQMRVQANQMNFYAEGAMKKIHQDFKRQHQIIKREILDLLDKAFIQNQRYIRQQLQRQGKIQPTEFAAVRRRIDQHEQTIRRLIQQLKGTQYRQGIADTVLHDFGSELTQLRAQIKAAKDNYLTNIGQIEPDRERIECIRDDLRHLFKISKRTTGILHNIIGHALPTQKKAEERSQPAFIFGSSEPPRNIQQSQPPERQRKSFFNFGL